MLHSVVNYFTIGVFGAAVLFEILGYLLKKDKLKHAAVANIYVSAVAAILSVITGLTAKNSVVYGDHAGKLIQRHELFGYIMAGGIVLLALWRFASGKRYPAYLVGFYLILSLIITGFAVYTTYTGNKLVYTHGVGVKDQSEFPDKPELRKQKSDSPLQKAPITKQK